MAPRERRATPADWQRICAEADRFNAECRAVALAVNKREKLGRYRARKPVPRET